MKILYGIHGHGNGHFFRSHILIQALQKEGISIDTLVSGRDKNDLWWLSYLPSSQVKKGLQYFYKSGKIDFPRTIFRNNIILLFKDIFNLNVKKYDLIIHDYEPISAWAAKINKIQSIGISNQNIVFCKIPMPIHRSYTLFSKITAPSSIPLSIGWHHFNQPIIPPIISPLKPTQETPRTVLVYLSFEDLSHIIHLLKPFKDYKFIIYGHNQQESPYDHITLRASSRSSFLQDLQTCPMVICHTGFTLISEALSLNKKILTSPVKKPLRTRTQCTHS